MDKRFFLAIALTLVVIIATPLIFPSANPPQSAANADSVAVASPAPAAPQIQAAAPIPAPGAQAAGTRDTATPTAQLRAETTLVATTRADIGFTSAGGTPFAVTLRDHRALGGHAGSPATIQRAASPLLQYSVVTNGDTTAFSRAEFSTQHSATGAEPSVEYRAMQRGVGLTIRYAPGRSEQDAYIIHTQATLSGTTGKSFLLITLPRGFVSQEADPAEDATHLAYAFKPQKRSASSVAFSKLDPGERRIEEGPLTWVAAKSKYFLVALLADSVTSPFVQLHIIGAPRTGKLVTEGEATIIADPAPGPIRFDIYAGPQEWTRLRALGREFENVNPYGGWIQGVVQPFSTIVMRTLLWMKRTVNLNYGWVLIIFGVVIRLALWPLNQSAMRSSIRMQRIQPELQAVQTKYKSDPAKMQAEIQKVYAAHGMSMLSPLMGCLPMLIPMPILFALFFVFQNTIEFRGVSFLWLPDISLKDPFYVFPILMGVSMFVQSWIGMRNAPPNPQAKMMMYMMPVMFTVLFINFASGLTLYYTVQNLAALPQQWLLSNERTRSATAAAG
jgi:YidC/Oxa1 family membrane protein insertase